jgi:hypothetical protein
MISLSEEKKEEKNEDGTVITRLPILTDEEERNFKIHIKWWRQLAKDTNKTLVLEAKLI